nr:putative uncharacterized protein DDB_G0271606 [Leptinotarsa decemlineata]
MIQPVMIPIPQTPFRTHMPQQISPMIQRVPEQMQMRPPVRPPMYQMENIRPPMPHVIQQQLPPMFQQQQQVPPMLQQQVPLMIQQQLPRREQQYPRVHMQIQVQPQMPIQSQGPQIQQNELPPNPILHHIVQQIIAQKIIESQKLREEQMKEEQAQVQQQQQEERQPQVEMEEERPHRFEVPPQVPQVPSQNLIGQRIPIPEEVLTQLNRLPNRDVIVAVAENDSEETPQDVRFVQEQRQGATEMNGRQTFARGLPVNIPIAMMPQEHESQEQEQQAASSEESRPHYVQPRSV